MDVLRRTALSLLVAALVTGCGGGGGGTGGGIPTKIEIIGQAPAHGEADQGISQMNGFVDGKPAFLSYIDATKWNVSVVGGGSTDLSTTAYPGASLVFLDGGIVVGAYTGGTFVYQKSSDGWVASSYPGLSETVLDVEKDILIGHTAGTTYAEVDLATGTEAPITLPANSALYGAKGNWLLFGSGGQFFVRNLTTLAEWQLGAVLGETSHFPGVINASGGVVGTSGTGTTVQAIYWEPSTGAPHVIDSYPGAEVEPGWISPDGSAFVINAVTDQFRSYFYVKGTKYAVADLEGGLPDVYGLSDDGRLGFGYTDSHADPDSTVAIRITYR